MATGEDGLGCVAAAFGFETVVFLVADGMLPNDGTYVVARYAGGSWHDSDDQAGCVWRVVKFEQCWDKEPPYQWRELGPVCLRGDEVDLWFNLPR